MLLLLLLLLLLCLYATVINCLTQRYIPIYLYYIDVTSPEYILPGSVFLGFSVLSADDDDDNGDADAVDDGGLACGWWLCARVCHAMAMAMVVFYFLGGLFFL